MRRHACALECPAGAVAANTRVARACRPEIVASSDAARWKVRSVAGGARLVICLAALTEQINLLTEYR